MIFISLGTQKFEFNRLLEYVDKLIESEFLKEEVFAQVGCTSYKPINYQYIPFLSQKEFEEKINNCSLFITHGGVGSILTGLNKNKKIIAIPRKHEFKEHVDNHQEEICNKFNELGYILTADSLEDLIIAIEKSHDFISNYQDVTSENKIVSNIKNYIYGENNE